MKLVPTIPRDLSFSILYISIVAVAIFLALAFAIFYPKDQPKVSPVQTLTSTVPKQAKFVSHDAPADAPVPVDLYRFALNALLVPLLDDSQPPRWTDVGINFSCDPGTSVMVDGEPMAVGKLVPSTAFTLSWNMDHCAPLGREYVELSGNVKLRVFYTATGLRAVVMPDHLRVESDEGTAWLRDTFIPETSLAK